jgi:hypothetical protein
MYLVQTLDLSLFYSSSFTDWSLLLTSVSWQLNLFCEYRDGFLCIKVKRKVILKPISAPLWHV